MSELTDYVIVGGGLAGCVVASRLRSKGFSVTLIEAGPDKHEHAAVKAPLAAFSLHGTELEYNYKTVPQEHVNARQICTHGGRLLSGGSSVNYGVWTRGQSVGAFLYECQLSMSSSVFFPLARLR